MKSMTSLLLLLCSTSFVHGQIFVRHDATGNNDGTSWQNAFTKLQPALDQADTGDQIWIAAGTYIPEGPSPDSSHFVLKKGVAIYGGFNGTESLLVERELWKDTTTLSGDILGDDIPSDFFQYRSDNAHHVMIIDHVDHETILDGLLFKGGTTRVSYSSPIYYTVTEYPWCGGALYIRNSAITVINCIFWDNRGGNGASIYVLQTDSSSYKLVIKKTTFERNFAHKGAGISFTNINNVDSMDFEIDQCMFNSNISHGIGFDQFLLPGAGGAIHTSSEYSGPSILSIRNTDFLQNTGYLGNSIYSFNQNLLIENCNFEHNYSETSFAGHGIIAGNVVEFYCGMNESPRSEITFRNTIFNHNISEGEFRGIVNNYNGNAVFENVLFTENSAHAIRSNGNNKLLNITMADNEYGLHLSNSNTEIQNSIFENETDNLKIFSGGNIVSKGGNISSDSTLALYLNGYNGYADLHQTNPLLGPDFIPLSGSPCIDAGNPEGTDALYDLAGNPRIQGNGIDAGAYESPFTVAVKDAVWDSYNVNVFPNPVQDILHVELASEWIGEIQFTIFNYLSQPVYGSEWNKVHQKQSFSENLNLLAPGEYVALMKEGKTTYVKKIIIQN